MPFDDQGSPQISEFSPRTQQCLLVRSLREIFGKESQHNSQLLDGAFTGNQNALHGQAGS